MKTYKSPLLLVVFFFSIQMYAQVGIGTIDPDASSILDMTSTTQGVLTPRMTTALRDAITNPATGLIIYNTEENAFNFYDSAQWIKLVSESSVNDYTGWGVYNDTQFTDASPGYVVANSLYFLPNNALSKIESQKPIDVTTFYDPATQKITGRNGDGLNLVIEFKMKPVTNTVTRVTLGIDIGGAVGEIFTRDFVLNRGQDIEHYYLSSFNAYTLNTWEANGGRVTIKSSNDVRVYDIRYVLTRTHKAR